MPRWPRPLLKTMIHDPIKSIIAYHKMEENSIGKAIFLQRGKLY